jgi:hypothetical protein
MHSQDARQTIHAEGGSTIQNVTQIIEGSKPDVLFSSDAAERIPNRIDQEAVVAIVKKELGKYFWKPPDLEEALATLQVQGWAVPLWRLQGEVSASWRAWTEEVVKSQSDSEEQEKQWVPQERFTKRDVDWLIPACGTPSGILRALVPAFQTLSRSLHSVRVDWRDYPFGEPLERFWPGFRVADVLGLWQHRLSVDGAPKLFEPSASLPNTDRESARVSPWPSKLEPEMTLLNAIDHAHRQIEDRLREGIAKSSQRTDSFKARPGIDTARQYWFPIWIAQYTYRRTKHAVVVNGYSGNLIHALLPLSFRAGLIAWSVPTLALVIPFWLLAYLLYSSEFGLVASLFALMPFLFTGIFVLMWQIQRH